VIAIATAIYLLAFLLTVPARGGPLLPARRDPAHRLARELD
jgi:hypothetical protein